MSEICERCGLNVTGSLLGMCPACLLASDDADTNDLPETPPGLELISEIGRGGMGRVFRAKQTKLSREVAVKFLPPELAAQPSFEARFAREARVLARLTHPNIVMVHDFGTTADGTSYLVMEYVSGGTLSERLPLEAEASVEVAIALAEGLAYAHHKNVVHRDIKPENVLFDDEQRPKLADFGIARLVEFDESTALTSASVVLGTPAYMAPETRRGDPANPRMDIFALGVLIEHMLTGRIPSNSASSVPAGLAPIVRRATAFDPRDRYQSAEELANALRHVKLEPKTRRSLTDVGREILPPDEESWQRAVALMLSGATSVSLYALIVSFTPRVLEPGDALPFVAFGAERLSDGRLATQARFETWPVLAAAGTWAIAFGAYGLLRRHWRHAGLDVPAPERPLEATRPLIKLAVLLNAIYVLGILLEHTAAQKLRFYIPVLGGVLELLMVYLVWMALLEAARRSRPLRKEPLLWIGLVVSLIPPVMAFARLITGKDH